VSALKLDTDPQEINVWYTSMPDSKKIFATCHIGRCCRKSAQRKRLSKWRSFRVPAAPEKRLVMEKVSSGVDGLITTLRDKIDAEVFEAGKKS
jgi:hypothetical protein